MSANNFQSSLKRKNSDASKKIKKQKVTIVEDTTQENVVNVNKEEEVETDLQTYDEIKETEEIQDPKLENQPIRTFTENPIDYDIKKLKDKGYIINILKRGGFKAKQYNPALTAEQKEALEQSGRSPPSYPIIVASKSPHSCPYLLQLLKDLYMIEEEGKADRGMVVGFDIEYKGQEQKSVRSIQLATATVAIVFWGSALEMYPLKGADAQDKSKFRAHESLVKFLEEETILKCGASCYRDAVFIERASTIRMRGLVDVGVLAIKVGITQSRRGLNYLGQDLLGIPKAVGAGFDEYAGMDAFIGFQICKEIYRYLGSGENKSNFLEWVNKHKPSEEELEEFEKRISQTLKRDLTSKEKESLAKKDRVYGQKVEQKNKDMKSHYFRRKLEKLAQVKNYINTTQNQVDDLLAELATRQKSATNTTSKSKDSKPKEKPKKKDDDLVLNLII